MKGFFKAIGRFFKKILPFLGDALDNPAVKAILISKLGSKVVAVIQAVVDLLDQPDYEHLSNEEKHKAARERIASDLLRAGHSLPSRSLLDAHIIMAVQKNRREGDIQVPEGT